MAKKISTGDSKRNPPVKAQKGWDEVVKITNPNKSKPSMPTTRQNGGIPLLNAEPYKKPMKPNKNEKIKKKYIDKVSKSI